MLYINDGDWNDAVNVYVYHDNAWSKAKEVYTYHYGAWILSHVETKKYKVTVHRKNPYVETTEVQVPDPDDSGNFTTETSYSCALSPSYKVNEYDIDELPTGVVWGVWDVDYTNVFDDGVRTCYGKILYDYTENY
jgi:hypothetical protein